MGGSKEGLTQVGFSGRGGKPSERAGDEGDASVPTKAEDITKDDLWLRAGDEGDASVPTKAEDITKDDLWLRAGDEGDASVPTLPLIHPRPYGIRGSSARSEKTYLCKGKEGRVWVGGNEM
jgi:hypothetical protein